MLISFSSQLLKGWGNITLQVKSVLRELLGWEIVALHYWYAGEVLSPHLPEN